jgi:hypothetical protein
VSTLEDRLLAAAAAVMGRKGGRAKSAKKANHARANGQKGGRPVTDIDRARVAAGVCRHCGGAVPCPSPFGDVRVGVRRRKVTA